MKFPWHLYLMAILYISAGFIHFLKPGMYLKIMPEYLPKPKTLVYLSGIAEIILGIAVCFPAIKNLAIYGLILMLLIFLLVHFNMLSSEKAAAGFPTWALWIRLPLQFLLIYWAYYYLRF